MFKGLWLQGLGFKGFYGFRMQEFKLLWCLGFNGLGFKGLRV